MGKFYPIDKNGLIIRVGDYVELPAKKVIIRSQKRRIKNCMATVVEIVSKRSVKLKIDKDNIRYWGEFTIMRAVTLSNLTYLHYMSLYKGIRKDFNKVLKDVYQNIEYRNPDSFNLVKQINNETDIRIQELQIIFYDKMKELLNLKTQLVNYSQILEVGDIVIWNDSMGGFDEVKLCKIINVKHLDPEYSIFNNDLSIKNRVKSRYDIFYGIKYRFQESEFMDIIKQQNIKTAEEFIKYALDNLTQFQYLPKDEHWID